MAVERGPQRARPIGGPHMELHAGQVAVVTGAAGGIGLALAERLAASGLSVVMADVDAAALATAGERIRALGVEALEVTCDVSDEAAVQALAAATIDRFGSVNVVCNNAGVSSPADPWAGPVSSWQWVLGVNLWGVVHGVRAFLPHLVASAERPHRQHGVDRRALPRLRRLLRRQQARRGGPDRGSVPRDAVERTARRRERPVPRLGSHRASSMPNATGRPRSARRHLRRPATTSCSSTCAAPSPRAPHPPLSPTWWQRPSRPPLLGLPEPRLRRAGHPTLARDRGGTEPGPVPRHARTPAHRPDHGRGPRFPPRGLTPPASGRCSGRRRGRCGRRRRWCGTPRHRRRPTCSP